MGGPVDVEAARAEVERAEAELARKRAALEAYDKAVLADISAGEAVGNPSGRPRRGCLGSFIPEIL